VPVAQAEAFRPLDKKELTEQILYLDQLQRLVAEQVAAKAPPPKTRLEVVAVLVAAAVEEQMVSVVPELQDKEITAARAQQTLAVVVVAQGHPEYRRQLYKLVMEEQALHLLLQEPLFSVQVAAAAELKVQDRPRVEG
jgi:hypothetical protein